MESNYLSIASLVHVEISQFSRRSHTQGHLVVVVDDPATFLVLNVTDVMPGMTGAPHVGDEGGQLVPGI